LKVENDHSEEGHHYLRGYRRDPHALHVALPARDARGNHRCRRRRRRGRRSDYSPSRTRYPITGKPDQTPEAFGRFLPQIKQASNAVVNITTGGAPYMRVEERVKPALQFKPEVASLNMGSMNIGLFHILDRYKEFKHSWEPEGLENSRDGVFRNTFRDIEFVLRSCADNDTRFEFECYDIGHLYSLSHFLDRGLVKPPLFVQSVFGLLGGIGPHPTRMSSTCGAPPIASSATVIAGPCSVLAAIR
jgi:uncharacterized protein (DUF849 family)